LNYEEAAKVICIETMARLFLADGMNVETPELIVTDAWKNLINPGLFR